MGLLDVLPQPRRMTLGGVAVVATPLRLRDLAVLEEWAATREPSPLALASEAIREAPEGTDRDRLVRDTWLAEEAREGSSEFGGDGLSRLLGTEAGIRMVLTLVLARYQPTLDSSVLDQILESLTTGEWEALERHAWGVHPLEDLRRWVDQPLPARVSSKPTTWAMAYRHLAAEYPWLSLECFGDLSLSQLRSLSGDSVPGGLRPGEDPIEFATRRGRFFEPPTSEEMEADGG